MAGVPNLVVTYRPGDASLAEGEVGARLHDLSLDHRFLPSRVRGFFQIRVEVDAKEALARLREVCREDPARFLHTYRWIPAEIRTSSSTASLRRAVRSLVPSIRPQESWRLLVNKGFYGAHCTEEIIRSLAEEVDRPRVDLENPDVILRVEIIDGRADISLHRPQEVLDLNQVRRELGLETL